MRAAPIREEQKYGGIRVHLLALLGKVRIPLQVDVGFGDVVTPAPAEVAFPTCPHRRCASTLVRRSLLLGHESFQANQKYERAAPALKEVAVARTAPLGTKPGRYRPSDAFLAFRDGL